MILKRTKLTGIFDTLAMISSIVNLSNRGQPNQFWVCCETCFIGDIFAKWREQKNEQKDHKKYLPIRIFLAIILPSASVWKGHAFFFQIRINSYTTAETFMAVKIYYAWWMFSLYCAYPTCLHLRLFCRWQLLSFVSLTSSPFPIFPTFRLICKGPYLSVNPFLQFGKAGILVSCFVVTAVTFLLQVPHRAFGDIQWRKFFYHQFHPLHYAGSISWRWLSMNAICFFNSCRNEPTRSW